MANINGWVNDTKLKGLVCIMVVKFKIPLVLVDLRGGKGNQCSFGQ